MVWDEMFHSQNGSVSTVVRVDEDGNVFVYANGAPERLILRKGAVLRIEVDVLSTHNVPVRYRVGFEKLGGVA